MGLHSFYCNKILGEIKKNYHFINVHSFNVEIRRKNYQYLIGVVQKGSYVVKYARFPIFPAIPH